MAVGSLPPEPWYADGLRFECRECGACCRGEGYVWVDRPTARRIARHLGLTVDELGARYLRKIGRRLSLTEKANHDCIFWSDGCTIYEVRPIQCRTFPFWPENLASEDRWSQAAASCRGMNTGRLYEIGEIGRLSSRRGETAPAERAGDGEADDGGKRAGCCSDNGA